MIIIPINNSLILENTTIQINKNSFDEGAIKNAQPGEDVVLLLKRDDDTNRLYPIGFAGHVVAGDDDKILNVQVTSRVRIEEVNMPQNHVNYHSYPEVADMDAADAENRLHNLREALISAVAPMMPGGASVPRAYLSQASTWNELAVLAAPHLNIPREEKYQIMKAEKESEKIERINDAFHEAMAIWQVAQEAQNDNEESYQKMYRENALKKQISYLQKQLDDMHPEEKSQIQVLEDKLEQSGMNETARAEADKVLRRLKSEGENGHEYGMLYDYLDFMVSLDWKKNEMEDISLDRAREILDREHYGLDKVKKRIIEQLAVMSLSKKQSGSILLLVGAPGTGKTSIAHSVANAMSREYVRISLGGVRDEADIRGHRRTYIGAMPGRIMDGIKKAGTSNPVMVLDEVDKLGVSYNGDPASALLEVLDPEQNNTFTDHYMNVPYDLSDVMFICTANSLDTIPGPLLDRMEVIQFNGYSPIEKQQIAKRHLIQKSMEKTGITEDALEIEDDAYDKIIASYTMEAGVRGLKKQLDKLARMAAVELVGGDTTKVHVTVENLPDYMDQREIPHDKVMETKAPGIVTGLAWTAVGGEILFIETMLTKGNGKVRITGQLGDVMKESAEIAVSLVKSKFPEKAKVFEENDLHIHVPAGATPKDGPSAGITLTTALTSLINEKPVDPAIGMTGEVSLRGNVMPIGGLPEKLMAAQRAGVKKVFIPKENEYDLKDVAPEVLDALTITPVEKVEDVLDVVLS